MINLFACLCLLIAMNTDDSDKVKIVKLTEHSHIEIYEPVAANPADSPLDNAADRFGALGEAIRKISDKDELEDKSKALFRGHAAVHFKIKYVLKENKRSMVASGYTFTANNRVYAIVLRGPESDHEAAQKRYFEFLKDWQFE